MEWDLKKVMKNIIEADTDDLLDRVTAYRQGMEPEAVVLIEEELQRRGVSDAAIEKYRDACQRECLLYPDGAAMVCSFCRKPAVARGWGWHKLWKKIPFYPRKFLFCKIHQPATSAGLPRPPA